MNMNTRTAAGREAWFLSNGRIELALTVKGGHMAPVTFFTPGGDPIRPYYVSPWQEEAGGVPGPGVLNTLRGDFFCLPFGADNTLGDEVHPPHGEVSESTWSPVDTGISGEGGDAFIEVALDTRIRPGRVVKRIELRPGQDALYIRHTVSGFSGPVCLGHHANMPGDRTLHISTRPLITGVTDFRPPSPHRDREYAALAPGVFFDEITRVPTIWKDPADVDVSLFPAREGFVDILQLYQRPADDGTPMWVTAAVPDMGYLWYSLKDPALLPSTMLWMENRGRHGPPWSGRNSCIGIEEVLGHLADGLRLSASENRLTRRGLRTSMILDGRTPLVVKNIQGVCRVPAGFTKVSGVSFEKTGVVFTDASGRRAGTPVDWKFVLN